MIRYGKKDDIQELKTLWRVCFEDEDAYINAFFVSMYADGHVLIAEENGVLMGASFFLPGKIYVQDHPKQEQNHTEAGRWQKIRYVYALAVYPQFRGKGIAGTLLRRASEVYQAPLIAEPANEGLVGGFYEPLGFLPAFYLEKRQMAIPGGHVQAAEIRPQAMPADAQQYTRIREARFQKHGFVSWPICHTAFAIQEHRANGGGALMVNERGKEDILLYYIENKTAVVTETTLKPEQAAQVLTAYLEEPCDRLEIMTEMQRHDPKAEERKEYSGCRLTGMVYGMPPVSGYLNLSLD